MFSSNPKVVNAFMHWFGIAIDSKLDILNDAWVDHDADLIAMHDLTQRIYKERNITHITVYRGCTENMGDVAPLSSWTRDKVLAGEYLNPYMDRNNIFNIVAEKVVPVHEVLFDTEFTDYYFTVGIDEVLGMMPCDELILIRTK